MDDLFDYESVFGTPNYAKQEPKWRRHRLKVPKGDETQTEFVCRIVPPVKSCKSTREWYVVHEEFYGYDGRDRKDKSKTRSRPFVIQGFYDKNKNPAMQKIYSKKKEVAELITRLSSEGKTQEEIELAVTPLKEWGRKHNKDVKYNINVMTQDNQLCVLQLTPKAYGQLDIAINKLQKDQTDPLDPKAGVWFVFTRTGSSAVLSSIADSVAPLSETRIFEGGVKAQVVKQAPISPEMAKKIAENAPDLRLDVVRHLPLDLVTELVNGPEDPEFVDKVWDKAFERSTSVEGTKATTEADDFFKKFGA